MFWIEAEAQGSRCKYIFQYETELFMAEWIIFSTGVMSLRYIMSFNLSRYNKDYETQNSNQIDTKACGGVMYKMFIIVLTAISFTALAVPEHQALDFVKNLIRENDVHGKPFFQHGVFTSSHGGAGFQIGYTKFGAETGVKGSIVLAPGRTESSMKYIEAAYDLVQLGYSPIYAIDHRGQGFSDRMLSNPHKGHVEKFDDYVDDFTQFVTHVVFSDIHVDKDNLYLVSNSMGGAITVRYFQQVQEGNPFKAAFHSGPMFEIEFQDGLTEGKARRLGWFLCVTGLVIQGRSCDGYATPSLDGKPGWEDYDASQRSIDPNHPSPQNMTHSVARYKIRDFLWNEVYPFIPLGGPTVRWVWQATKTNQVMRVKKELKKITLPMLIMTGEWDIRADNPRHAWYCRQLKRMGKTCEYIEVPGAYHELLIESDQYRTPVMQKMVEFFDRFRHI